MTSNKKNEASSIPTHIGYISSCVLPTPLATFQLQSFFAPATGKEQMALTLGDVTNGELVLARLHSECSTGDALFSQRYDCGAQLETALNKITK